MYSVKFCSKNDLCCVLSVTLAIAFTFSMQMWHYLHHSRSFNVTDFGTNRKLVCDFQLVNNTKLRPILHHFQFIVDYWSNFLLTEAPLFKLLVQGKPLNSKLKKYGSKKLEASLCGTVHKLFRYLEPFTPGSEVWLTNSEWSERTASNSDKTEHKKSTSAWSLYFQ